MVAIKDAGVSEFLNASGSETAQTIRAAAAAILVEVDAVRSGSIVPVTLLAHKLSKFASTSSIYRILKDSPGFVPEYSIRGKLGYWFEREAMKPYARQQGEPHYPRDLAEIALSIKGPEGVGAPKQEPLFNIAGKVPTRGNYLVPARIVETDQYGDAQTVLTEDISMLAGGVEFDPVAAKRHLERAISVLVGIYVNEFGDTDKELE